MLFSKCVQLPRNAPCAEKMQWLASFVSEEAWVSLCTPWLACSGKPYRIRKFKWSTLKGPRLLFSVGDVSFRVSYGIKTNALLYRVLIYLSSESNSLNALFILCFK